VYDQKTDSGTVSKQTFRSEKLLKTENRQWRNQNFFRGEGGSTYSVEETGQRKRESGGGSPLVRGSAQFANE
jgi:hypothetical protein